jgi:hypothetical protein
VAAEARIRAAAQQASPSAVEGPQAEEHQQTEERPQAEERVEVTEPAALPPRDGTNVPTAGRVADGDQAASAHTPEVAGPGPGNIAAVWGGPGFMAGGEDELEVVRFWPWSESDADAEGDPEPGRSAAEPQDSPQASYARRNRIARGYSIPRLSRAKRPGAIPGS